jgi:hypothetical protein
MLGICDDGMTIYPIYIESICFGHGGTHTCLMTKLGELSQKHPEVGKSRWIPRVFMVESGLL